MGLKRIVSTDFWTDGKVDDFTPEDKYFMLYLLTNPCSSLLGIYEISIKQAAFQMGYSPETVVGLIDRFQNKYGVILYSKRTSEIAIKNYLRHGIVKGGKPIADCLISDINRVKDKELINDVFEHVINYKDLNPTVLRVISNYINGNGQEQDQEQDNDNGNGHGYGHGHGVTSPLTGNVTGYDTQNKNKGTEKRSGNPFMSFAKGGL
ncbi:MAG: hypothetical protein E7322_09795 [Clostridiales bacterium]|nr:hypothetical protein [Clostridiales bacterium]